MKQCPKCKSKQFCKDGIVKQKQRYKCKDCNYHFTVDKIGKPDKLKRDALILYLMGQSYRSIGRLLNISDVTVLNWIKSIGGKIDEIRDTEDIEVVGIDEMHTYAGSKKTNVGYGLLLIELGNNSSKVKLIQDERK